MTSKISSWLRSATLIVIGLNISFNYAYDRLPGGTSIVQVTRRYPELFTPAGYVFSIWGLIYLSFIVYGIIQLLPAHRREGIYNRLSAPLMVSNVLGSVWIQVFTTGHPGWSLVVIAGMLLLAGYQFVLADKEVRQGYSRWLLVPFALYFGWLSVAVIANASVLLVSLGWNGGSVNAAGWAIILVSVATILGTVIGWKYKNAVYPAVIAWACAGIAVARKTDEPEISTVAIIAATILGMVILLILFAKRLKAGDRETRSPMR